jgi:ABC-type transport system involved in multi-copper enzyme maturation permease subunit
MRSIWYSLAWKEWHEHKWKLAALTAVLCGVNLLLLREPVQDTLGVCFWTTAVVTMPLALFLGVGAAAGERSQRTAEFLAALPVPSWRVALVKLLAGLSVLSIAIAATYFATYWWTSSLESSPTMTDMVRQAWPIFPRPYRSGNWFVTSALATMMVAVSIFLWTAATGLHRSDEISSGARASLIMMAWWGGMLLLAMQLDKEWFEGPAKKLIDAIVLASPAGVLVSLSSQTPPAWLTSALPRQFGLAVHLGIAAWFVYAYARVNDGWPRRKASRFDVEELIGWLGPPRKSPVAVIAWKQIRESTPVVLVGVGAALLIATLFFASEWSRLSVSSRQRSLVADFAEVCGSLIAVFSIFIALVVGVGAALVDLSPPLNNFWRSRPINPDVWFWTKFIVGFLVLVITLLVPVLALAGIARHYGSTHLWRAFESLDALIFIGVCASLYVSAMAMTCLVRQPIYGAILGIAVPFIAPTLALLGLVVVDKYVWPDIGLKFEPHMNVAMPVTVAVGVSAALVVGWLAVRNDWGWKK